MSYHGVKVSSVSGPTVEEIALVRSSFGRCSAKAGFLDRFYTVFFASDSRVLPFFAATNLYEQKQVLRRGLISLIMFAERKGMSESTIRRLRASHGPNGYNIPAELYDRWRESLLVAVAEFDEDFGDELAENWVKVLEPGLKMIQGNSD